MSRSGLSDCGGSGRDAEGEQGRPGAGPSIWAAALKAAGCQARAVGRSFAIQWQPVGSRLRYTATDYVTIDAFGVALRPGETLEVRWIPGDTGYSAGVHAPRS